MFPKRLERPRSFNTLKEFDFYSKWSRKPLKYFKEGWHGPVYVFKVYRPRLYFVGWASDVLMDWILGFKETKGSRMAHLFLAWIIDPV